MLIGLGLLVGAASVVPAHAQTCTVSSSSVTLNSGSCSIAPNSTLNGSPAVHASTSAQITTNNVTINPFNGGSTGGLADTNGIIIFSSGSTIEGNWSTGASAQSGGQIIFQPGSTIQPSFGGGATALLANGAGSAITATGLSVTMSGGGGNIGALATGGGTITLNTGTSIAFNQGGGGNTGLWASGAGSQIITNGATLSMPGTGGLGGGDIGVRADTGANVNLQNTSVTVVGNGGNEMGLSVNGATVIGTNNTISVSSASTALGGVLSNGANVTLNGGSVTTSGTPGSYGFLFQSGANGLNLNGTTVTSASDAFAVQGGTATINTSGATVTGNPYSGNFGILLSATNGSTVTMTSSNSTLTGAITTAGGSTSNVTLSNGTLWNMTATSNATNLTNSSSEINVIAPTASNSYKTLTVNNYAGAGGNIVVNTYLGTDNSPSDQLVINGGTATGTSTLTIHNTTGPGEETTANGIPVVVTTNGGTTAANAFSLAGEVRGGAYDYYLFRGGIGGSDPNNWFLRSTFDVGPEPEPPTEPDEELPPVDPPSTLTPGAYPIIGPEVATYGIVQPTARQLGFATLGTLNQRIGDTMTLANAGADNDGWSRSGWARFFGQQVNDHYQAFADPRSDGWLGGFQGGLDLWRGDTLPGHRDAAGVYFAYGRASVDVSGLVTNSAATAYVLTQTGKLGIDAFSAGAYWTHYGPSGWYLDAVVQNTLYQSHATTQYAQLDATGYGFVASLEAGYPIALPFLGPHFVLEPQAQMIWQQVSFGSTNDNFGPVNLGTTSGPTGRLGARGQWTILGANGAVWQPYVGVNFWRDWNGEATTIFGGFDQVSLIEQATRTEALAGVTAKLDSHVSLYAQGGYQFALEQTYYGIRRDGAQGDVGLRYNW